MRYIIAQRTTKNQLYGYASFGCKLEQTVEGQMITIMNNEKTLGVFKRVKEENGLIRIVRHSGNDKDYDVHDLVSIRCIDINDDRVVWNFLKGGT